jgi:hypothetical protein
MVATTTSADTHEGEHIIVDIGKPIRRITSEPEPASIPVPEPQPEPVEQPVPA